MLRRALIKWRPAARCPLRRSTKTEFSSEQAHLPAEQPPAREDPRLPAAHAHPGRPGHSVRSPDQGPRQAVGLSRRWSDRNAQVVVLAAVQRLRRSTDFAAAIRGGRRVGRGTLVVHLFVDEPAHASTARAGFVVSKAVGNAVTRNKVRRRLRHLVRPHLDELPAGTSLVVRALPPAAEASYAALAADLEGALTAARRPRRPR